MTIHYSDALVLVCADDRYSPTRPLSQEFGRILMKERASDRFLISVFGASLEFSQPPYLPGWLDRIETARALHIKRIVIIDHLDCGAFAKMFGEMDKATEKQKHLLALETAKKWLAKNAGEFEVHAYLQDNDKSEKIF